MEPAAAAVWVVVAVIGVSLLVWWWLGVHPKSRAEQAAEILRGRSGAASRRAEKGGGIGLASVAEHHKGTAEPTLPPLATQEPEPETSADEQRAHR
jgi:hypothetical protein